MATTKDFIEYVIEQIDEIWNPEYKKMFGEYMVYINRKPLLLICDNTVFVKELECIENLSSKWEKGFPYNGAKEHYIVDIDDKKFLNNLIGKLEKVIPVPKKRKKMKSNG
ncbi:MAG: transcriptional regulator [Spirochaetes bacterium]|nr:transcriptional regulator [Spirochaetota bacterium]